MSTDIGGRPVLRPAGNVARANLKKATKPPPSPVKPHTLPLTTKISPPSSQPPTPKIRSPLSKASPPPSSKQSSTKPPSPPLANPPPHAELVASLHPANEGSNFDISTNDVVSSSLDGLNDLFDGLNQTGNCLPNGPNQAVDGLSNGLNQTCAGFPNGPNQTVDDESLLTSCVDKASPHGSSHTLTGSSHAPRGSKASTNGSSKKLVNATRVPKASLDTSKSLSSSLQAPVSRAQKSINPRISLTKSTSDVFQRGTTSTKKAIAKLAGEKNLCKLGSVSFDERSLATMVAAKKAAAHEADAQRKLKVAEYGRKQGKAGRVAPEASLLAPAAMELKRCKFITAQSDPLYVAYHDEQWGVPVHDDRKLFELLVLSGFQGELSWATILQKREAYWIAFLEFRPSVVARLSEKQIVSLEADKTLGLPGGKVRGIVESARSIMEVIHEFGSLDAYLWGFLNNQPMVNNYRYAKHAPVKTSKAESISKDLVRRGFRFVGPTTVYSFMQAAGMTNDHLVQCFRHQECMKLAHLPLFPMDTIKQEEEGSYQGSYYEQGKVLLPSPGDSGDVGFCARNQELLTSNEGRHQPEFLMGTIEPRALDFSLEAVCYQEEFCAQEEVSYQDLSTANDQILKISKDFVERVEQESHDSEVV